MDVMDLFSLKGKAAVITGGYGRYGKQMVLALAQAGAKVYTTTRDLNKKEAIEQEEGFGYCGMAGS